LFSTTSPLRSVCENGKWFIYSKILAYLFSSVFI
jgi:hypothetical protein